MRAAVALLTAAAIAVAGASHAETGVLRTLDCDFESVHIGTTDTGIWHGLEAGNRVLLRFTGIDLAQRIAAIEVNGAAQPVEVLVGSHALTLLQVGPGVDIALTTLLTGGPGDDIAGTVLAAHSRQVISAANELVVSQYIGSCTANS